SDVFGVAGRFEFETADARGLVRIKPRDANGRVARANRTVDGVDVENIVERDVAAERVIKPLLRLDREHPAPAGHQLAPLDGVDADVRAAVNGVDAVAVILAPQRQ